VADTESTETSTEERTEGGAVQALERAEHELEAKVEHELEEHLPPGVTTPAPGLLPGEVRPHPNPAQYVLIAVVLCVVTAFEVGLYYLEGDIPDALIIALLLGSAVIKFFLVASWYMHLRTDQVIFRRFFIIGLVAAVALYLIVLLTLHVFE
jgi:cytochrome c oxidase subunit 4